MKATVACVVALVGLCSLPAGSEPAETAVVELAAAYAQRFFEACSNVAAEEQYTQERTSPRGRRTLRSDFVLVRHAGAAEWHVFRDVFEVDGSLIRDPGEERLLKLFLEPAERALPRAREIARDAARYNIQDIGNLNNPVLAMAFLQRQYGARFRFSVGGRERKLGPEIRAIRFEEHQVPTIFRRAATSIFARMASSGPTSGPGASSRRSCGSAGAGSSTARCRGSRRRRLRRRSD